MRPSTILLAFMLFAATLALGWSVYSIVDPSVAIAGCSTSC
jgi:hypothetical protein